MAFTDFKSIAQVQETFGIKYTQEDYIQYDVGIEHPRIFNLHFIFIHITFNMTLALNPLRRF